MQFDQAGVLAQWQDESSAVMIGEGQAGLPTLLAAMAADDAITRVEWAAYMLATAEWETAYTYAPVRERGLGAAYPYGSPVSVTLPDGSVVQNVYYGRGYVQLTLHSNYVRVGRLLGMGNQLEYYPDQALDPAIAYQIMTQGMLGGWFSGRRLSDFINDSGVDYLSARGIINGNDKSQPIAVMAQSWQARLTGNPAT